MATNTRPQWWLLFDSGADAFACVTLQEHPGIGGWFSWRLCSHSFRGKAVDRDQPDLNEGFLVFGQIKRAVVGLAAEGASG